MPNRFFVARKDIRNSEYGDPHTCLLATAIQRQLPPGYIVSVMYHTCTILPDFLEYPSDEVQRRCTFSLPTHVASKVCDYESRKQVKPFSFKWKPDLIPLNYKDHAIENIDYWKALSENYN